MTSFTKKIPLLTATLFLRPSVIMLLIVNLNMSSRSGYAGGFPEPIFRGADAFALLETESYTATPEALSLSYMTADQMAQKLQSLTGYYHPGFEEFAKIIGSYDPDTGSRTNDRPSLLSVTIMGKIIADIGERVVAREKFLDPSKRVVFSDVDLSNSPSDFDLEWIASEVCSRALYATCPEDIIAEAQHTFRQLEQESGLAEAFAGLLAYVYQIGSIFYY